MFTREEYENLINNSPLFEIDKESSPALYKSERYNFLTLLTEYYSGYIYKKKPLEEYSMTLMETAIECIKYYDRSKGDFLHLFAHFLHWYYSLGEFIRFSLNYYLYNETAIKSDTEDYLSKASNQELAWFHLNYANAAPLIQIVYIRLITEVERRKSSGLHGNDKAVESLYTAVEKLVTRVNISPEAYFAERLYPIVANIRNRRLKQFHRLYTGKKLKK